MGIVPDCTLELVVRVRTRAVELELNFQAPDI